MKINLLTVCTDVYPMEYARKTITRFGQLTNLDVTPYCITDRPDEIKDIATPLSPEVKTTGWWHKMLTYSPNMPQGFNVYLDLDIVLIKNFDEEIRSAVIKDKKVACVSDAIGWYNNKYSSSMMMFRTGNMADIFDLWVKNRISSRIEETFAGGDQVWTGQYLRPKDVYYLDEKYPNLKMNLKFHLGEKVFGEWKFRKTISPKIKTVDCGGRPKPHTIMDLDYITKNWHNVEV